MTPPKLCAVTVTCNDPAGLRLTLESLRPLFAVWPAPEWEHIVVDGASTDGTREWLGDEERLGKLRAVLLPDNRGFAAGVNAAAAGSHGTYLCLLNNDTLVAPGWLSTLFQG